MPSESYLIVEQQQTAPANLPELLHKLADDHQLDAYQCRQRLLGRGLTLMTRGPRNVLEKISPTLAQAGVHHWLIEPRKPGFTPQQLRGLEISAGEMRFTCRESELSFPRNSVILAVLADISGHLREQSVKQLLSSHAYRGLDNIRHLSEDKILQIILRGLPVLDLYLLDEQRQICAAVRALPGKFDPRGLGERATLSSRQNLQALLEMARDYAGDFYLFSDFGLADLPGCRFYDDAPKTPETQRRNLINLVRYGWLMADLLASERRGQTAGAEDPAEATAAVQTALLMGHPALAADPDTAGLQPLNRELAGELAAEDQAAAEPPAQSASADAGLPAPPPGHSAPAWHKPGFWIGGGGAVLLVLLVILSDIFGLKILRLAAPAFNSGLLPFLFGAFCLWSGFHYLRSGRQVENTPTSRVRSLAMGMVEVKGRALRRYALVAPMTQVPCAYYRLTKYRRRRNEQWRVSTVSSSNNVPFELADETGRVEIDPGGCRVRASTRQEGRPGQTGMFSVGDSDDEKWVEETIVEGTLIYVLGYASVKKSSGPSRQERTRAALRELKGDDAALEQFDRNGDGHISAEEWDAARAAVEDRILEDSLSRHQQRKKQEDHVVIGKRKGYPLIISETPAENLLTSRYLTYSILLFIASTGAVGGAIYLLINYLS